MEEGIKDIIDGLDPESVRMQLIKAARQFKTNWVDLGEFLTKVATDELYSDWGYKTFEEYCRKEIKIKKATAIKLTNAYFFITNEEPELYKGHDNEGLPDIDAVSVLQRAKNDNSCSPEQYGLLKEAALGKGQSGTTLARKYKKLTEEVKDEDPYAKDREQNLNLVQKLKKKIGGRPDIPENFKEYLKEMEAFFQPEPESAPEAE